MNNEVYNSIPYQDINLLNEMLIKNNFNDINNMNKQNNVLTGSYDGYLKGNMFNSLYNNYKNYKPAKLIPNNEQAEKLLNLNQLSFALHDIRLYLDIHPEDRKMLNLFNEYSIKVNDAMNDYESSFGPIRCYTPSDSNLFSWEAYSFPWEMEEN